MDNKFFTFIKPYLSFIDNGHLFRKPFSWLYTLIAILNLILPIFVLYQASDNHVFDMPAKYVIVFLLVWVVIAFVCWISFQLWWDRRLKVIETSTEGDEFVATPVFSHFIQTLGEWFGTLIGVIGFSAALITTIFLGEEGRYFSHQFGVGFFESGILAIILFPVYGFLIIVFSRFLAEQFRALSSIANNTRRKPQTIIEEDINIQNIEDTSDEIQQI